MTELSVEAVDSLADAGAVDAPEYVLYGGKGGVGKTTMAAATGVASARDGTATLVVSTDPAHSLSDSLGVPVPGEPARLTEEFPLYAVEIDPDNVEDGPFGGDGSGAGPMGGLDALLGEDNPMGEAGSDAGTGGPMPGADEAAAIQLLMRYMDDDRFDRVVVDTAPTGHTLRLLELPELLDSMMGRMIRLRERFSGMVDSVKGFVGGDDSDPEAGLADLEAMADRIGRLRTALRDGSRTEFRVVMVPEEMSVLESERLVEQLEGFGMDVSTLVVNRVMQDLTEIADLEVPADRFVAPEIEDCEFCRRRWDVQRGALGRAQDLFRGCDVRRVPLFAEEVSGVSMLGLVAACLD